MKLYFIRHVETVGNIEKKMNGITPSPYTSKGEKMFSILCNHLLQYHFDAVYSSPIPRAKKIAHYYCQQKNKEIIVDNRLQEINFGIFESLTYSEAKKMYPEYFQLWCDDYINYKIPDGDSLKNYYEKFSEFIMEQDLESDNTIAIFGHGGTVHNGIINLLNLELSQRWHFYVDLGSITLIEYKQDFGNLKKIYTPEYNIKEN
jgi:alpha-ribazole phosphatase/probable phosphoglycerate mutase